MDSTTLRRLVTVAGHPEAADAADALLQPAMKLIARPLGPVPAPRGQAPSPERLAAFEAAMAALPIGVSRLGGLPDLPKGAAWPALDGVPMQFLAQLSLDEVAPLDPLGRLPTEGSLLFFQNSQYLHNDLSPNVAACAVIHAPGAPSELVRAAAPRVPFQSEFSRVPELAPFVYGLAGVSFGAFADVPAGRSPFVTPPVSAFWSEFRFRHHAQLWPDDTGHHLLGYLHGDDYAGAYANGTDDQLLLELYSDEAAGFRFGDLDSIRFVLRKDELAARDFSKVRLYQLLG